MGSFCSNLCVSSASTDSLPFEPDPVSLYGHHLQRGNGVYVIDYADGTESNSAIPPLPPMPFSSRFHAPAPPIHPVLPAVAGGCTPRPGANLPISMNSRMNNPAYPSSQSSQYLPNGPPIRSDAHSGGKSFNFGPFSTPPASRSNSPALTQGVSYFNSAPPAPAYGPRYGAETRPPTPSIFRSASPYNLFPQSRGSAIYDGYSSRGNSPPQSRSATPALRSATPALRSATPALQRSNTPALQQRSATPLPPLPVPMSPYEAVRQFRTPSRSPGLNQTQASKNDGITLALQQFEAALTDRSTIPSTARTLTSRTPRTPQLPSSTANVGSSQYSHSAGTASIKMPSTSAPVVGGVGVGYAYRGGSGGGGGATGQYPFPKNSAPVSGVAQSNSSPQRFAMTQAVDGRHVNHPPMSSHQSTNLTGSSIAPASRRTSSVAENHRATPSAMGMYHGMAINPLEINHNEHEFDIPHIDPASLTFESTPTNVSRKAPRIPSYGLSLPPRMAGE